jgi:hypothetical protein
MEWQLFVTIVVLVVAVGYAFLWAWRVLKQEKDPCCGCEMKKNCKKFCQFQEK